MVGLGQRGGWCSCVTWSASSELSQMALEMHIPRQDCSGQIVSTSDATSSGRPATRHPDAVLLQCRAAIKLVVRCLDCPCSADRSVALTAYLVASKIVAWYEAILGDSTTNHGENHKVMAACISSSPISLGSYSLDAQAIRSVRARIVLSELHIFIDLVLPKLPIFWLSTSTISSKGKAPLNEVSMRFHPTQLDQPICALKDRLQRVMAEASKHIG